MAGRFQDILGTVFSKFQIGIGATAVNLKEVTGKLRARNKADAADAPIVGSIISASGDAIQLNEDATSAGADWLMTLNRPATGMTHALNVTFPSGDPAVGQALTVSAFAGDNITLGYTTVAAGTDKVVTDTTSIAFGTASPLAMFTLPANAVFSNVTVVIDTPFNGAPTLSAGIAGTLSKYLASTQVDLTAAATVSFEVEPGLASVGTTEAIIATYAAGGATAGAGRLLVAYSIPN